MAASKSLGTSSGDTPPISNPLTCDPVAAIISVVLRPPIGSKPASRAPRSPARRGIQAKRAPVAWAKSTTAFSAPGI